MSSARTLQEIVSILKKTAEDSISTFFFPPEIVVPGAWAADFFFLMLLVCVSLGVMSSSLGLLLHLWNLGHWAQSFFYNMIEMALFHKSCFFQRMMKLKMFQLLLLKSTGMLS